MNPLTAAEVVKLRQGMERRNRRRPLFGSEQDREHAIRKVDDLLTILWPTINSAFPDVARNNWTYRQRRQFFAEVALARFSRKLADENLMK